MWIDCNRKGNLCRSADCWALGTHKVCHVREGLILAVKGAGELQEGGWQRSCPFVCGFASDRLLSLAYRISMHLCTLSLLRCASFFAFLNFYPLVYSYVGIVCIFKGELKVSVLLERKGNRTDTVVTT